MISDLTVIMLTPNLVPIKWAQFHKQKLLEAIGDTPLITVSTKPLDFGLNIIQEGYGLVNIYKQVLRAAKIAKTPWIAMADDDTLYPKSHFEYRPGAEGFFYNLNRWHIFTWGEPIYFHKPWQGNGLMMATRELVIKALENRFENGDDLPIDSCHELGTRRNMLEKDLVKSSIFYTDEPVLSFYHDDSFDSSIKAHKKRMFPIRAYDIPVWGKAQDMRKKFI